MKRAIEAELQYCPNCMDEYRAEITTCAACRISLVSGKEMLAAQQDLVRNQAGRNMVISPDDELVSIRKGPLVQMKDFQTMLKREGIPSIAVSEDSNCGQGSCGTNLFVQIRREDLQDVVAILERDHIRSTGLEDHDLSTAGAIIDTEAEQATCPACGYSFSTTETTCPDCGLCFA
ncbi:MAG: hypothetical protein WGN25_15700 [Candidatus Electrothrix sp. GW3-4]|uniref:zinc ribbon-containing (seleno)protein DG n=1 Tax=Candidatus Electrothrix sp. GW3-4 TaxID=3126740 RepID=UPI0030D49552